MLQVVSTGAYYPPVDTTWKILTTGASQLTAGPLCNGGNIWEFDSSVAGPTSNEGWLDSNRWPALKKDRLYASCSKVGQKVIITGGQNVRNYESLQSTEVLDLLTKQITSGEILRTAKKCLGAVTIMIGGQERMFSFGGFAQFYIADFGDFDYAYYNEVDED